MEADPSHLCISGIQLLKINKCREVLLPLMEVKDCSLTK